MVISIPMDADFGLKSVMANPGVTVKAFATDATSVAVVTVTARGPGVAFEAITN